MSTLAEDLSARTCAAHLVEPLEGTRVRCLACAHRCPIPDGHSGVCKVRFNRAGVLHAPFGYASGIHCDPIEKKPFFHVQPGSEALSFGMLGCSFHCGYCQNWLTSQSLRDSRASLDFQDVTPAQIIALALRYGAASVVSTYNEPLITAEWAAAIFGRAHEAGLLTGMVSNGSATPEVLEYLKPHLDLLKIDLKTFDDRRYRELGARLQPVLDTIHIASRMGFWVEVVTLVVPGFNDSHAELQAIARFLAAVSPYIPWHVTAFHPDYRMDATPPTPPDTLMRAVQLGREAGLFYVYAGNLPNRTGDAENTHCHCCRTLLVQRRGFTLLRNVIGVSGLCPRCAARIPGRWS